MFAHFVCALLVFCARKFPVKSPQKTWTFIADQTLYNKDLVRLGKQKKMIFGREIIYIYIFGKNEGGGGGGRETHLYHVCYLPLTFTLEPLDESRRRERRKQDIREGSFFANIHWLYFEKGLLNYYPNPSLK